MEAYLYKYSCPGHWYGSNTGLRNVYVNTALNDQEANVVAKEDSNKLGYKDCSVTLLVKYKLTIESVKTYADITRIPFSEQTEKISLD